MQTIEPSDAVMLETETQEISTTAKHSPQSGRFSGIRVKLTIMLLVFGLLPALVLFGILYTQEAGIKRALTNNVSAAAVAINDVIDRNLFERYGDVQAFGLNTAAHDPANWGKPGADNPLVAAMNGYVTGYGIYKLMLVLRGMSRLLLKFAQQALLVEQATQRWPAVQVRG